jgi:hypothetical protein
MAAFSKFFDAIVERFQAADDEWKDDKDHELRELLGRIKTHLSTPLAGPSLREVVKKRAEVDTAVPGILDLLWEAAETLYRADEVSGAYK